ncbi:glycosyltransferase [Cellulomonas cellasea]|uniref:glycosyltransferase family 2 protein n=1 Tax=Cellulomonas cellasea TaxID=43670 RepID=UPI0025A32A26|nr:glycosyltransferase [Cellulomonas cellasea]MDM8083232.1 glycosyltransferase [Cellulomonas cellasea]
MTTRSADGPGPMAGVVVPAHNEERTITRLLTALTADPGIPLEVVVVCNGCSDRTADVARRMALPAGARSTVTVVELAEAGKAGALLRGDEATAAYPRVYVDADVEITAASVAALAAALDGGPDGASAAAPSGGRLAGGHLAAGPERQVPRDGVGWPVRWYYDVWERLPQVRDGLFGRGVVAVSAEGHARLRGLPSMLSDDLVMSEAFTPAERVVAPGAVVVVRPPRTLRDLLRRRVRVATGNAQADGAGLRGSSAATSPGTLARLVRERPSSAPQVGLFVAVALVARTRARRAVRRGDFRTWLRDESSRVPAPLPPG